MDNNTNNRNDASKDNNGKKKVLLMILPFWTPLIPPLGISCIKSHIETEGHEVLLADGNTNEELWGFLDEYMKVLGKYVSASNRGNFYSTGHEVLRNHLTAHFYDKDCPEYADILKTLVARHFFQEDCPDEMAEELKVIVSKFFDQLKNYVLGLVEEAKPDIVGISVYAGTFGASLFAFKTIKEKYPSIITTMGGGIFANHLDPRSPNFERFLKNEHYIDKLFIGEGEILFSKFLKGELDNEKKYYTKDDIGSVPFDINKCKAPDFETLDVSKYPHIATYTSRSCPFQCSFCSETVQWGKYRKKEVDKVVAEMDQLYQKHGYQLFLFGDSLLNPVIDDLSKKLTNKGTPYYWDGYLRADPHVCDVKNTVAWRNGGFYRARLGVESGSQNVLNLMDKKITKEQIMMTVSSLAYAGIKTTTYWVIGFPGETEEDFLQTLDTIEKLKDDIYEAECNSFIYLVTGQVGSDMFSSRYKVRSLYPEKYEPNLMIQSWYLESEPSREVTYDRIKRFVEHCRKLGIPNPYSMQDIFEADERWKRLHENSVPTLIDFRSGKKVFEPKKVSLSNFGSEKLNLDDDDFLF